MTRAVPAALPSLVLEAALTVSVAAGGAGCMPDSGPTPTSAATPTPTPTATPAPTPTPVVDDDDDDTVGTALCSGVVQDTARRPMTTMPKPTPGEALRDPEFGTPIRRITAVPAQEGADAVIKPMYSTVPAWNADESLLILWHRGRGHELYDGRSYAFIRSLPLESPTDLEQVLWDPEDPDLLYHPSNLNAEPRLMRYDVRSDSSVVLRRFDFCPVDWGSLLSLGSDPMYLSWGSGAKLIGLQCGIDKFLYDVDSDEVVGRAAIAGTGNAPQPAPSGEVAYLDGRVYDSELRLLFSLPLANPWEHASLGSRASGHDTYNAVAFDPPPGEPRIVGTLVGYDLQTGAHGVVIGPNTGYPYPPSGTHVSAIAHRAPGWVAVSVVGDPSGQELLDNELLLANVDSGVVCRVAHHRSWAGEGRWGYWSEPHVVISPSGTRLLFASDWGNGSTVDSYVAELPAYRSN